MPTWGLSQLILLFVVVSPLLDVHRFLVEVYEG